MFVILTVTLHFVIQLNKEDRLDGAAAAATSTFYPSEASFALQSRPQKWMVLCGVPRISLWS